MVMVDMFKADLHQSHNRFLLNTALQIELNLIAINKLISYQKQLPIMYVWY